VALFTTQSEIAAELVKRIEDEAGALGFEYVGKWDEKLVGRYPAVVVSPVGLEKEVHGTQTFLITIRIMLWIYHADMTETYRSRSDADIELAEALEEFLERPENRTLNDNLGAEQLIFGFIETSVPGVLQPSKERGGPIVGTRLQWHGITQRRWSQEGG